LVEQDINDLILDLEPEWGRNKIENLKLIYAIGDQDRQTRLSRIINLSNKKLVGNALLNDQVLLPPSSAELCYGKGEVFVGDVCYGKTSDGKDRIQHPLYVDLEDLNNHVILTGLSGVGKTSLAMNLVVELAKKDQRVIIFDWNRQWRHLLSNSKEDHPWIKDMRVYTIGRDLIPFYWNLFFSPPPSVSFSSWIGITTGRPLQRSLLAGQGVQDFLENEAEALYSAYQKGILKLLPNVEDIMKNVEQQHADSREKLWKQSTGRVTRELLRPAYRNLFNSRTPIDIAKNILSGKGVIILEMDIETPPHIRVLFQEVFLTYMMLYYMHLGESDTLRTQVVFEEFQNMLPNSKVETQAGSSILETVFREGRKMGIGLIAIAQEPSALPNYVVANAKVQAHFAVQTKKDIEATANSLFLAVHQIPYMDLVWRGETVIKVKGRVKNCLVKTNPLPFKRKVSDEELKMMSLEWQNQESYLENPQMEEL